MFFLYAKVLMPELMNDKSAGKMIGKLTRKCYLVFRVLNTDSKIDVKLYQHVCHVIGISVVHAYPWARMNETTHSVNL